MKTLSKLDIAQRTDRATRATTLRYVGRGLSWTNVLYGQPEGVFFALDASEVPLPDRLVPLAAQACVFLEDHPDVARLRTFAEAALVAEAWVAAPALLADITEVPTRWLDSDRLSLERKHQGAMYLLEDQIRLVERDLRRRILSRSIGAPPVSSPAPAPVAAPVVVSEAAVRRVEEAVQTARSTEMPQRLPQGARRRLAKLTPGAYLSKGDDLERHDDVAAAMRAVKREDAEVILDWDGEWPVVVRRYEAGRTIYRIEDALRRMGEETEESAA